MVACEEARVDRRRLGVIEVAGKATDWLNLVDPLNRAALSIATNIAEGNGRFTSRDRKNFFGIARGSVQECVPLLELARRRGLIEEGDHLRFKNDLEEIAKMISGLIRALDSSAQ